MSERRANFGDIFKDHVASDRLAAIDLALPGEPRHVTYGDLDRLCDSIAGGLVAAGFGEGDRVGVLALNRVEYIAVLFGAVRAGCVPVPINVKLPRDAVEYILNDAGVRLVFSETEFRRLVREKTEFWSTSGIDLQFGLTGFQLDAETLTTIAAGGVAMATPDSPSPAAKPASCPTKG